MCAHFKVTMEYHKTKDILHVMRILGHRNIKNTLVYTHLVNFQVESARAWRQRNYEYISE